MNTHICIAFIGADYELSCFCNSKIYPCNGYFCPKKFFPKVNPCSMSKVSGIFVAFFGL